MIKTRRIRYKESAWDYLDNILPEMSYISSLLQFQALDWTGPAHEVWIAHGIGHVCLSFCLYWRLHVFHWSLYAFHWSLYVFHWSLYVFHWNLHVFVAETGLLCPEESSELLLLC